MQMSAHARARMRQRGITPLLLQIIQECGMASPAPGGATEIFFGRRQAVELVGSLKRIIQAVDKTNGTAILIKDNRILTIYKRCSSKN